MAVPISEGSHRAQRRGRNRKDGQLNPGRNLQNLWGGPFPAGVSSRKREKGQIRKEWVSTETLLSHLNCSRTVFPPLSPPTSLLVTVHLFFISMSRVIFCLLVCFVDQVPLIGEIIWYLSFTAWLISLSTMLSSSIHAVVKGRSFFFLSAAQYSIVLQFLYFKRHLLVPHRHNLSIFVKLELKFEALGFLKNCQLN